MSRLYRKWLMDVLETLFFLNTLFFTILTSYSLSNEHIHLEAISYTSVIVVFMLFLLIIVHHMYTYTIVFSKVKRTKLGRKIDRLFAETQPKPNPRQRRYSPPPDNDIHRFDELLDELDCPVNTDDYNTVPLLRPTPPVEPTYSVVELPMPRGQAAPDDTDHDQVTDTKCLPGDVKLEFMNEAV